MPSTAHRLPVPHACSNGNWLRQLITLLIAFSRNLTFTCFLFNLEIVLAFLTCLTESNGYESSQEAIDYLEDFQGEIAKSVRRLQSGTQKLTDLTDPEDILEKISKSPTQKLCCNIMQAALDAMATADSMYHSQKDQDDLIAGLWAVIFLLAANVAGKLCDLTIPNVHKKEPVAAP